MILNARVGGSVASQPTEPSKIPNDPEGGAPGSPAQAPGAWSAWNQGSQFLGARGSDQGGAGVPQGGSGSAQGARAAAPYASTVITGPNGSAVDLATYGARTQNAVKSNAQFVSDYQNQEQNSQQALLDALYQIADMSSYTNPYNGLKQTATVS